MRRLITTAAFLALATPAIAASEFGSLGLDELSPEMRGSLTDRLSPGQDPAELVETTILNNLMAEYGDVRDMKLVGSVYRAEVRPLGGEWTTIEIDPKTYIFASD